jgi:hypothetical protein
VDFQPIADEARRIPARAFSAALPSRGGLLPSRRERANRAEGRLQLRAESIFTTAIIATEIPAAINPYSMAVAPD